MVTKNLGIVGVAVASVKEGAAENAEHRCEEGRHSLIIVRHDVKSSFLFEEQQNSDKTMANLNSLIALSPGDETSTERRHPASFRRRP